MKIGFVADKLNITRGGSNFSLDLIARMLADRGHEITVLTVNFAHENDLPEERPYRVVEKPVTDNSRTGDARQIYELFKMYEKEFSLFHVFNPAILPVAGMYRYQNTVPVVGRLNNFDNFCTNTALMDGECHKNCTVSRKFLHQNATKVSKIANIPKYAFDTFALPWLLNQTDRLFAVSPQTSQIYSDIGVDNNKLHVVPNFYDPNFGSQSDRTTNLNSKNPVLYVGTLNTHKGVNILVESARFLPPTVSVEIVGTGPMENQLKQRTKELGIEETVHFHGWVEHENLPSYYKESKLFVHPGLWPEPFNRTILEAMQCQCPPIVSNIGGPPWVIGDCGETFERGSEADLSKTIQNILRDEDKLATYRNNCSKRVSDFSPEDSVDLLENHYESVAGEFLF